MNREEYERAVRRALREHEETLAGLPNVVGLGITQDSHCEPPALVVTVYVSRKLPPVDLRPEDIVPKEISIGPAGTDVVRTRVVESGFFNP